ncbi:MAG: ATP-binding cassette domain-containing protein [bacterium]|nr:ATP-binding cassette domain-containing protein [bacterium]
MRHVRLEVDGRRYLDGVSLTVAPGEAVVIAGLPGCGKSFVPRCILGLPGMDADEVNLQGDIIVAGQRIGDLNSQELQALRRRVGSVMRDGGLIENMDVRANVTLPLTYHYQNTLGPAAIQARCDAVLEDLQLSRLGAPGIRPVALNREERLYVSLARAVICEPFLLLFDEPCLGLSPGSARRLSDFAFSYQPAFATALPQEQGDWASLPTRIVTTADLGRYLDRADRFILLHDGRLEVIGDRMAVLGSHDPRVRQLLGKEFNPGPSAPVMTEAIDG